MQDLKLAQLKRLAQTEAALAMQLAERDSNSSPDDPLQDPCQSLLRTLRARELPGGSHTVPRGIVDVLMGDGSGIFVLNIED